jgi:exopolysaccharide biosynthesis polyprenyl glycosylphosphotransferase
MATLVTRELRDDSDDSGARRGSATFPEVTRAHAGPALRRDLVVMDLVALLVAWSLPPLLATRDRMPAVLLSGAMVVGAIALIAWQRLYLTRVCAVRSFEIMRLSIVAAILIVVVVLVGAEHLVDVPASALVGAVALTFLLLTIGRGLFQSWLRVARAEGHHVRSVAVIGMNDEAAALVQRLADEPHLGYRVEGIICAPDARPVDAPFPWLGVPDEAATVLGAAGISGAIVVVSALGGDERNRLLRSLLGAGVHVQVSVGLERVDWRRLRAMPLAHEPLFYVESPKARRWRPACKRTIDVVLGTVALVATAPVLLAAMFAVLVSDGRPVLYRQVRLGKDSRRFPLLKVRTMCLDADAQLDALRDQNARTDGPLFKLHADPRVTRVGRVLRATSIDELPQLVNMLRGEMSLVGPRPPLPVEAEHFDDELKGRFRMRPGITGLWQVEARDNPTFRMYRHLDLFYLENWSLGLDLAILFATVELLVGRTIARAWAHRRGRRGGGRRRPASSHAVRPLVYRRPRRVSAPTEDLPSVVPVAEQRGAVR